MSSILDYKEFRSDVFNYLGETIDLYRMGVAEEELTLHPNTQIFFSNEFSLLELSTVIHFPYSNVVGFKISLKNGDDMIELSSNLIDYFIGVREKREEYAQHFYKRFREMKNPTHRMHYQESLKYNNQLFLELYQPLFTGQLNAKMYLEWVTFVSRKFDIKRNLNLLPSYDRYKDV